MVPGPVKPCRRSGHGLTGCGGIAAERVDLTAAIRPAPYRGIEPPA